MTSTSFEALCAELFNDSKYTRWYWQIINNARSQNRVKGIDYYENHHIIPKSLGGGEAKVNKILLTFKEHFICHWLLVKMVSGERHFRKMNHAMKRMTSMNKHHLGRLIISSWYFVKSKNAARLAQIGSTASIEARNNMSTAAKGKQKSEEHRSNISKSKKGMTFSIEARDNMSKSHKGSNKSAQQIEMLANHNKGRILPIEHRSNISKGLSGKSKTVEHIFNAAKARKKTYSYISPNEELVVIDDLLTFCERNSLTYTSMVALYNGNLKSHGKIVETYRKWRSANPALINEARLSA